MSLGVVGEEAVLAKAVAAETAVVEIAVAVAEVVVGEGNLFSCFDSGG